MSLSTLGVLRTSTTDAISRRTVSEDAIATTLEKPGHVRFALFRLLEAERLSIQTLHEPIIESDSALVYDPRTQIPLSRPWGGSLVLSESLLGRQAGLPDIHQLAKLPAIDHWWRNIRVEIDNVDAESRCITIHCMALTR